MAGRKRSASKTSKGPSTAATAPTKPLSGLDWDTIKQAVAMLSAIDPKKVSAQDTQLITRSTKLFEALVAFKKERDSSSSSSSSSAADKPKAKTTTTTTKGKKGPKHHTTKKINTPLSPVKTRSSITPKSSAAKLIKEKALTPSKKTPKPKADATKEDEKVYVVEKILDRAGRKGRFTYKVKWRGYKRASWVLRTDFLDLSLPSKFDKEIERTQKASPARK